MVFLGMTIDYLVDVGIVYLNTNEFNGEEKECIAPALRKFICFENQRSISGFLISV